MDHKQTEQFDLVDRYLMGKLLAEESASFEEHFVDCPQCIAQLQTTKNFMQDLRFVAANQASQIDHHPSRKTFGHFLFRKPLALALCSLLIAAVACAAFVVVYTRRLRTELNQAQYLSRQWEGRYEEERQSAISADRRHQETEVQRVEQLRAMEAKLKDEEAQRAKIAAEAKRQMLPEGNFPIFVLTSVRGRVEPANPIILPRSSTMFAFSISLEGEQRFENYRIRIFDNRRRLIRESSRLMPDQYLSIILNPGLFRPGNYSLILEGIKKGSGWDAVGNYPFLIIKTP